MVIFTLKVHSFVDVITNSSNELFVGKAQSKEEMKKLLLEAYPNYLKEYEEIKSIDEITIEELETYFEFFCSPNHWPTIGKNDYPVPNGFTFEEVYQRDKKSWNNRMQYKLRENSITWFGKTRIGRFTSKQNFEEIKNKLDPNKEMYFLFSHDQNPNFEYQDILSEFMEKYHLG